MSQKTNLEKKNTNNRSIDKSAIPLLEKAENEGIELAWDRLEKQQPQCGFGLLGVCCRNCNMGPCRIDPFREGPQKGVCGANEDTIVARNLLRMIAAGAAAHSDHARDVVETLLMTARGQAPDYELTDLEKLKALAELFGIEEEEPNKMAEMLALKVLDGYGTREEGLEWLKRAPKDRIEVWEEAGVIPRGVDREIVEVMHRTHMGVDTDYVNLILHGIRTALSDGWGGSMVATTLQDVLFGTPKPTKTKVNLGVLSENEVNIIIHGHEPILSEKILEATEDPELIELAQKIGAEGINISGMCCTGIELLMRKGVPMAGNFLNQELAILTGAVEAMVVDVQCIMPALTDLSDCYHTEIISTSPKAKFPGATHIEFEAEKAGEIAKKIVRKAIENYKNRIPAKVDIPDSPTEAVVGFSVEARVAGLGGELDPLLDAIKSGKIRGVAGLVGCNNPKIKHDYSHVTLTKELLKNNVLCVVGGCNATANAKAGLLLPEAAEQCGEGLKEVCQSLGIPPVLHMGSCVDNTRILVLAAEVANALGVDISDLPLAGAAPEWMSEKAVSIGTYFVGSGILTVLGTVPPILGSEKVVKLLTEDAEEVIGGKFAVETDPYKAAELMLDHIDKKREGLGI